MYIEIMFKTFVLYFIIVFAYRIMGKKEVGQLNIIDLIVSLLIAELAALSIEKNDVSIMMSIVPIFTLVFIQVILSFISLKSDWFRKFLDGNPSVIIQDGKLKFSEMSKLRYSLDDLVTQLREKGIDSIENVNYAVLENDGKLSVFSNSYDYPMPIIMDGVINNSALIDMKKNINWVYKMLDNKNINLKDVFYAFYSKDKLYIILKNELI